MHEQINALVTQLEPAAQAAPQQYDQPKVAFPTDLKLTADQERKMIDHAFNRLAQLDIESGRNQTLDPTWWFTSPQIANTVLASQGLQPAGDTFLGKRSRFDAEFAADVSWRPWTLGPGTIFGQSNMTVPLSRRIARQMIARAKNSFFGTDPWFTCIPAPSPGTPADDELASEVERFVQFKLRESRSKADKEAAIEAALTFGECAVKTSYVVRDQLFNTEAVVLHNIDGEVVMGNDGNVITPEDEVGMDELGNSALARDGTPYPEAPIFQKTSLNRRQVLFEGAKSEVIYYKDFLCPLTARDVQTADCIVHLYDKVVAEFVDLVVKRGMVDDSNEGRSDAAQRMIAIVKQLSNNDPQPKSAADLQVRPGDNFNQSPNSVAGNTPISQFAEFYMWFDANEDGIAENIQLIADKNTRAPVYYDHVANVTTDGLRPIEIIRINPVKNRWYGLGIMELFEPYQMITDLLVNRWNFSQSKAGRVDFWDPTGTLEGDRDQNLKMNWGQTYTKKPGKKMEDILESAYLNDTKFEAIQTMMQFFMQLAMNESGVANANDNLVAGMAQAKLATGIVQIEQSGDELFKPIIADLTGPLNQLLTREVEVTLANMNPQEAYAYLEGDVQQIKNMTPDMVRNLRFKIQINLTTHKNQLQLQVSGQAAMLVEKFYTLPPEIQVHVAPFYRQQLKALDPKIDGDTTIQVVMMQPGVGGNVTPFPGTGTGGGAAANTQLGQKNTQAKGVTAPGGTPVNS